MREQKKVCYIKALKGKNQGEDGAKAGNIDSRMYGWIDGSRKQIGPKDAQSHAMFSKTKKQEKKKTHNKPGKCRVSGFRK